mgnify:CR=1 FL=1
MLFVDFLLKVLPSFVYLQGIHWEIDKKATTKFGRNCFATTKKKKKKKLHQWCVYGTGRYYIIPVLGTVKEFYITWKDTNRRGQIPGWIANSQSFCIFLIFFQFMFFDCVFLLARITSLKIKYRHRIKKKKEE